MPTTQRSSEQDPPPPPIRAEAAQGHGLAADGEAGGRLPGHIALASRTCPLASTPCRCHILERGQELPRPRPRSARARRLRRPPGPPPRRRPRRLARRGRRPRITAPARLACARCDGGGCDACARSGALRSPADAGDRVVRPPCRGRRRRRPSSSASPAPSAPTTPSTSSSSRSASPRSRPPS